MDNNKLLYIKNRTVELYAQLPADDAEYRASRTDIRDELLLMHQKLFHKIAQNTFLDHNRYEYEDKYQEILLQFLEIWWWYQYPPRYKTPASFSSYFYIRLKERAERSLNELSYSMYRSTLVECQKLLGLKHWTEVTPDRICEIEGHTATVQLAMRMFNRNYYTNIDDQYNLGSMDRIATSAVISSYTENPSDIQRLLISEMIYKESELTETEIRGISSVYCIPVEHLNKYLEPARQELYKCLKDATDVDNSLK